MSNSTEQYKNYRMLEATSGMVYPSVSTTEYNRYLDNQLCCPMNRKQQYANEKIII